MIITVDTQTHARTHTNTAECTLFAALIKVTERRQLWRNFLMWSWHFPFILLSQISVCETFNGGRGTHWKQQENNGATSTIC